MIYPDESYRIMGACFEVYKEMGPGFLEPVYQECLELEFEMQGIPVDPQARLSLSYKQRPLTTPYIPDFLCYGEIILEIKAVQDLNDIFRAQVLNYLKITNKRLGILVNFNHHPKVQYERLVN